VTDVTPGTDWPILHLGISPAAAAATSLPRGTSTLSGVRISNFDLSLPDAFARAREPLANFVSIATAYGAGGGFNVGAAARTATQDPRLPALAPSTAAVTYMGLFNPAWTGAGPGVWDLLGEVTGLEPSTPYTVVLARLGLEVRGGLDHAQRLTGFPVSQPDSLFFLPGTPGGSAAIVCNFSQAATVTTAHNLVVVGTRTTNASGAMTGSAGAIDCPILAGAGTPWWRSTAAQAPAGAADSLPFGRSAPGQTLLPGQFNYVLIYEGVVHPADVPAARPVIRAQMGPDVDAAGNPVPNALAPYPTATVNTATFRELPGGAAAFATPGAITLQLAGLPTLGGPRYQLFAHRVGDDAYQAIPAKLVVAGDTVRGVTFDSPGEDATFHLVIDDEAGVDLGAFNTIVLSIEDGQGAATPSTRQFLFTEYLTPALALRSGPLTLGTFGGGAAAREFRISGAGTLTFYGDSLFADLQRLAPPPAGFQYRSYLALLRDDAVQGTPARLNVLTLNALGDASDRIARSQVGSFHDFNTYLVVLEPIGSQNTTISRALVQVSANYQDKFFTR
jgi:hypothetical protein